MAAAADLCVDGSPAALAHPSSAPATLSIPPQITTLFTRHHVLFRHAVARPDALRRLFAWLQHDLELPPASLMRLLHRCPAVLQVGVCRGASAGTLGRAERSGAGQNPRGMEALATHSRLRLGRGTSRRAVAGIAIHACMRLPAMCTLQSCHAVRHASH